VADNGEIWMLNGGHPAAATGLTADEFIVARPAYSPHAHIRVPGLRRNARLLLALFQAVQRRQFASLSICSPWCSGPKGDEASPEVLLYASRGFDVPYSVGGWRRFDAVDASLFKFAAESMEESPSFPDLNAHPAGWLLRWIDGVDEELVSQLLGIIVDPRWFVDPAEPDRANKLQQFLGLDPATQQAESGGARWQRNRLVLHCWKLVAPPDVGTLHLYPRRFLWWSWHAKGGGWKGDLAASKRFVAFVRQAMLMSLCRGAPSRELFVPELFFRQTEVAQAFAKFLRSR
jgi:hypothetical protein